MKPRLKVESPSPDWDEDPPRPPQGIMEEGRSKSEDGEESSIEDEKVILNEDSFLSRSLPRKAQHYHPMMSN